MAAIIDDNPPKSKWHVQIRWNKTHRQARRAHALVALALRRGELKRGKCEVCSSFRVKAHHDNYSEPLVIRWLCRKHHLGLHADQRRATA